MNPRRHTRRRSCRRIGVALLLLWALTAGACAPSVGYLVDKRSYNEALCASTFHSDQKAKDQAFVLRRMERDLDPTLHIHAVTEAELRKSLGAAGARMHRDLILLRVSVDTNKITGVGVAIRLGFDDGQKSLPHQELTRTLLARYTREVVMDRRRKVVRRGGWTLKKFNVWFIVAAMLELSTAGIIPVTRITGHVKYKPTTTHWVANEAKVYMRYAPRAEALYRALLTKAKYEGARYHHPKQQIYVFKRTGTLQNARFTIHRRYEKYCRGGEAALDAKSTVSVPSGTTLEARINTLFGNRFRRLTDLERPQ